MLNHVKKEIRADIISAFTQALLSGNSAELDALYSKLKQKTKALKPPKDTIMNSLEVSIANPEIDMRCANDIVADARNQERQISMHKQLCLRNPYHADQKSLYKSARKTIKKLKIDNRAYTWQANLKNTAIFAFSCAALGAGALAVADFTQTLSLDNYISTTSLGGFIGSVYGAFKNTRYFKSRKNGLKVIKKNF